MKLGVFGGTFDPPHIGHLIVADQAWETLRLDRVLFVPAGQPWLKDAKGVTEAHHRLEMVKIATRGNPRFEVSDIEVGRDGPSYTVDTLRELAAVPGGAPELYAIVGLDALAEIDRWHDPSEVLDLATLVGYARPGFEKLACGPIEAVRAGASDGVVIVDGPQVDISSTAIRERVLQRRSIRYMVPDAVEEYIRKKELYGGRHAPV